MQKRKRRGRGRPRTNKKYYHILRRDEVIQYARENDLEPVLLINGNYQRYALSPTEDSFNYKPPTSPQRRIPVSWDEFFRAMDKLNKVIYLNERNNFIKIVNRDWVLNYKYNHIFYDEDLELVRKNRRIYTKG